MSSDARVAPWSKCGRVDVEPPRGDWFHSHAALPTIDAAGDDGLQLYFSVRDALNRSRIARGSLTLGEQGAQMLVAAEPALDPGSIGAFDESGVTSSCLVADGSRRFLYYTGWSRGVTVPFYLYVGLAISDDDGRHYQRASRAPILERSTIDPYLTASPWVLVENGLWRMWYVSAQRWEAGPNGAKHYYHIRYAESSDGFAWRRSGHVCIDFGSPDEYAFGRPCVVRDAGGTYRMWYSYRGPSYRIGYAESRDGLSWRRLDAAAGIDVTAGDWDSDMVEYPVVFEWQHRQYMLYNGNDYGRTGIGVAMQPCRSSAG